MKNIINRISKVFSKKSEEDINISYVCSNATGELNAYCVKEYTYNK